MSRLEKINEIFLEYSQRIEETKEYAREMISYSARLESFSGSDWPFAADANCRPEKLAEAGFFFHPSKKGEPIAFDFINLKQIEWEEHDDPWEEATKRRKGHYLLSRRWSPSEENWEVLRMKEKDITVAQFMKICAAQAEGLIEWEAEEVWECLCKGQTMWDELFKAGELANATYSIAEDEDVFHKWESEMTKAYHELKTNGKNLAKINNKRLKKNSVDFKTIESNERENWAAAMNEPFMETYIAIVGKDEELDEEGEHYVASRQSILTAAPVTCVPGGAPSMSKTISRSRIQLE